MGEKIIKMSNQQHKIHIVLDQRKNLTKPKEAPHLSNNDDISTLNPDIQDKFNNIVAELNRLVGLEDIKKLIFEIFAFIHISRRRSMIGLKTDSQVFHMIFKGNPGTGKTTVARIMARMFYEMGILSKGHLVEVERADLVGEYIGHTAQKTREQVKKALGGILFIDEAYSLYRGGEKDFGRESIDALVKAMEDHKNDFILILAGYSYEMERFIHSNPGLHSRFPIQLDFEDYTVEQLMEIAEVMVKERDYILSPSAKQKLKQLILEEKANPLRSFSNARLVRNRIEKAIRNQAVRLISEHNLSKSKQALMTIQPEDFLYSSKFNF
ncbi:AAA family ATPase [Vulcanibacillus modesticaldus]|uniref:AAA family ATPase n=1 Tax=Vulcanibacillus modesticaldus TaxID=337097 RepID=A0A1D2YWN9_9BACI|nr:AAA family ATPase [Vulcanibacillus modesticaldus]OEG00171.1 AAA family ATPase [Vulcanibacillus modesticaldus]